MMAALALAALAREQDDQVMEMKAGLEYLRNESKRCFEQGLIALDASEPIDFGPYGA